MTAIAKRVEPSRSLLQGRAYVPAALQNTSGILARWLWERSSENPANYPDYGRDYQAAEIAEHQSPRIPGNY